MDVAAPIFFVNLKFINRSKKNIIQKIKKKIKIILFYLNKNLNYKNYYFFSLVIVVNFRNEMKRKKKENSGVKQKKWERREKKEKK